MLLDQLPSDWQSSLPFVELNLYPWSQVNSTESSKKNNSFFDKTFPLVRGGGTAHCFPVIDRKYMKQWNLYFIYLISKLFSVHLSPFVYNFHFFFFKCLMSLRNIHVCSIMLFKFLTSLLQKKKNVTSEYCWIFKFTYIKCFP